MRMRNGNLDHHEETLAEVEEGDDEEVQVKGESSSSPEFREEVLRRTQRTSQRNHVQEEDEEVDHERENFGTSEAVVFDPSSGRVSLVIHPVQSNQMNRDDEDNEKVTGKSKKSKKNKNLRKKQGKDSSPSSFPPEDGQDDRPPLPPHHLHPMMRGTTMPASATTTAMTSSSTGNLDSCQIISTSNDSTLRKGLLWQMKDGGGFFSRWKERYFILTKDYLTCFKKSSSSNMSMMGSFAYKLKLVDIEFLDWKVCADCSGRRRILPRSMTITGDHNHSKKKKKDKKTKRSKSNDGNNKSSFLSSDGESGLEGNGLADGTQTSSSSRSSSRKSKGFRGSGKEVISIVIKETGSQIDLWTSSESCLNEWMFILKEAVDTSKGRREAFIKKSQTLCPPNTTSVNVEPFALKSYWIESSRKSIDYSKDILGTPSRPPLTDRSSLLQSSSQTECLIDLKNSYSSLRVNSRTSTELIPPNSASCQRRVRGRVNDNKDPSHNGRSESMVNFSKRLSILTGKEISFPFSTGDDGPSNALLCPQSPRCSIVDDERPPPVPGHQIHSSGSSGNFIRIRDRQVAAPPIPPHASPLPSRLSSPDMMLAAARMRGGGEGLILASRLAPQCKQSSLVSLDRRLMPNRGVVHPGGSSQQNFHQASHVNGMSNSVIVPPGNHNDSGGLRRSALLRSASSTAAAVAAASNSSGDTSSTLGPNHQFHFQNHPMVNQPVPRSLQVSPALTQRSLYAQHIFSQPDPIHTSHQAFCTSSRVGMRGSGGREEGDRKSGPLDFIRQATSSRASFTGSPSSSSALKSATSEFSFVRPDSPLTLPYNKSRSFYGRPVSSVGVAGSQVKPPVVSSLVNNSNNNSCSSSSSSQQQRPLPETPSDNHHVNPPPRPPLPKQVSLQEESSTLFRCARNARSASVAGGVVSSGVQAGSSTTTTASSSSSGFSSSNGSSSCNFSNQREGRGLRSSSTLLPESSDSDGDPSSSSSIVSHDSQAHVGSRNKRVSSSLPDSRKSSFEFCEEEEDDEVKYSTDKRRTGRMSRILENLVEKKSQQYSLQETD